MNIYQIIKHDFHDICFQEESSSGIWKRLFSKIRSKKMNKENKKKVRDQLPSIIFSK
jgi:hypothetical protein